MGCSRRGCVASLPVLPPAPSPARTPGLQLTLDVGRETRLPCTSEPLARSMPVTRATVAGTISYLLSSTDAARLTFSKSSMDSVSRTCFCRAASSRRHSWTTLGKLGEASFWGDARSAPG